MAKIFLLLMGVGLTGTWGALLMPARGGYGYTGHNGWQNASSFFYFGHADQYPSASVRGLGARNSGIGGK